MKILNVTCVRHDAGFDVYNVIVDKWSDKRSDKEELYNACDPNNFGGDVLYVNELNGIHIARVKIYID